VEIAVIKSSRSFDHIDTWVFDLDNTLYPHHVNLWQQVDAKIGEFVGAWLKVSPEEARQGKAVDNFRKFFRTVHQWTAPGAWFGLQHIVRNRVPRDKKDLEDVHWVTHVIFPGGLNPRIEEVVQAVNPYWEIVEMHSRRLDYRRTTFEWRKRLRDHEDEVRRRWGDQVFEDYDRYLSTCVNAFDKHYSSLAQYSLRRID